MRRRPMDCRIRSGNDDAWISPLPIDAALPELTAALRQHNAAVLVAPPGAGKTTRVPLVLAGEPWAEGRRILVLEPRRLAARAAAERMAKTLGEQVGDTVGLAGAVRLEGFAPHPRSRSITEGVFTRLILDDPDARPASPRCCSTSSTSARSTPISASPWRATCSKACARICGSWSCRRRSTARASPSSSATRR